jgi:hypothetical protein
MLKTREEIRFWLNKYWINNYTVNDDLTVDVKGDVDLHKKKLESIEVQFGVVTGDFLCSETSIKTLKGCPKIVKGDFDCFACNITSLEYGPVEVGGDYGCGENTKLTSLKGCPKEIGGILFCDNTGIKSIKYAPKAKEFVFEDKKLDSLFDDYIKLINKLGYDKTQKYWPSIEKMKTLGDK